MGEPLHLEAAEAYSLSTAKIWCAESFVKCLKEEHGLDAGSSVQRRHLRSGQCLLGEKEGIKVYVKEREACGTPQIRCLRKAG